MSTNSKYDLHPLAVFDRDQQRAKEEREHGRKVYIVERVGIYRQGVLGVFWEEADAMACAEKATATHPTAEYGSEGWEPFDPADKHARWDGDGYHRFIVSCARVGSSQLVYPVKVWAMEAPARWRPNQAEPAYQWRDPNEDEGPEPFGGLPLRSG